MLFVSQTVIPARAKKQNALKPVPFILCRRITQMGSRIDVLPSPRSKKLLGMRAGKKA